MKPSASLTLKMAVSLVLGLALATFTVRAAEPPLRYATTWVGNTFGGGPKWIQNFAENLHVLPDGTCIVGSFWDEAGREVGIYKEGQPVGKLDHTHMRGGKAVAVTGKYIFYANTSARPDQPEVKAGQVAPKKAICYFGVSRFTRDGKPAPFAGGVMNERHMQSLREAPDNHDLIPRGLATDGHLLYVADTAANRVVVLDAEMMVEVRAFAAEAPEQLALDGNGHLWAVQSGGRTLIRMNTSGAEVSTKVLPEGVVAEAIDFAPEGILLVCDNGPRQQVIAFNSDLQEVDTFGERGGMFAGPSPGRAGPFRLARPTGCGFDAAGNFYVACNVPRGGTVLRAFASKSPKPRLSETNAWSLKWELLGLEFVDVADALPASDGHDLFTADDRYAFDPATPAGKGWRWVAHTLDPFRFPDDLRLHQSILQCATSVRVLGGKTFLCQRGMWQGVLGFYRIDGDLAVPCAVLSSGPIKAEKTDWRPVGQPLKGRWFWRDTNGNGRFDAGEYTPTEGPEGEYWASNVDARGDIWQAGRETGLWRWRFTGLDAHDNPQYDSKPDHWPMPAPFTDLLRTEYDPATDTMYLTGQTKDHPISNGEWGTAGSVLACFDHWTKEPKLRYRVNLPYTPDTMFMEAFHVAGELAFFVDCKQATVFVHNKSTGQLLGTMKPGPEVSGESGWTDFRDCLRAVQLKGGDYLVFVEEDWKAKILVYRLENPLKNGITR